MSTQPQTQQHHIYIYVFAHYYSTNNTHIVQLLYFVFVTTTQHLNNECHRHTDTHIHTHTRVHTRQRGDWRNLCIRLFGCCCWLSSATNGGCDSGWEGRSHREWFHHWTHAGASNTESVVCCTEYTTTTTGRLVAGE